MSRFVAKSFSTCVFLLFLAVSSHARTWIVPADAPTIQAGIDSAMVGDTVLVRSGTYFEHGIELTPGVNLVGEYPDQPEAVVIDGQQLGRIMRCAGYSAEFVIEGLTFTGGLAAGSDPSDRWGGALLADNIRATVRNCVFRGNSALPSGQGGAVFIQDYWWPKFFDCSFDSNSAEYGGAVRIRDHAEPTFDGCRFSNNYAQARGGALYIQDFVNFGSAGSFNDCEFVGNHAVRDGGVMFAGYGSGEFTSCLFADNSTGDSPYYGRGGAVYIDINTLSLSSCTFVGNRSRVGSAIYAYNVCTGSCTTRSRPATSATGGRCTPRTSTTTMTSRATTYTGTRAVTGSGTSRRIWEPTVTFRAILSSVAADIRTNRTTFSPVRRACPSRRNVD